MNITHLTVTDPRRHGEYRDPFVTIFVDHEVDELADPIYVPEVLSSYRIVPCGPFYAVEYQTGPDQWDDAGDGNSGDIGEVNKYGLVEAQLAPVVVESPTTAWDSMAMQVPRLRRLLRKHTGNRWGWLLKVDEEAALRGLLKWRLDAADPMCYGGDVPGADNCLRDPVKTIVYKDTHLNLCNHHMKDHETRIAHARRTLSHR